MILAGRKPLEEAYRARMQSCWFEAEAATGVVPVERLSRILGRRAGQVRHVVSRHADGAGGERLPVRITRVSSREIEAAETPMRSLPGASTVSVVRGRRPRLDGSQMGRSTGAADEALR